MRIEKSPSRNAACILARVCNGRDTAFLTASPKPSHTIKTRMVTVQRVLVSCGSSQISSMTIKTAAEPEMRDSRKTRFSWPRRDLRLAASVRSGEAIFLKPAIQRASAQPERFCRLAYVSSESCQRLLDQERLHIFQAHLIEIACAFTRRAQRQVARANLLAHRHQHRTFHRMI